MATLLVFSDCSKASILGLEIRVVAHCDQRWHVEGVSQRLAPASYERLALHCPDCRVMGARPVRPGPPVFAVTYRSRATASSHSLRPLTVPIPDMEAEKISRLRASGVMRLNSAQVIFSVQLQQR